MNNWMRATIYSVLVLLGVSAGVFGIFSLEGFYFFYLVFGLMGLATVGLIICLAAMIKEWLDMLKSPEDLR